MATESSSTALPGTVVWLHSLTTTRLNGQTALIAADAVARDAAAPGRCKVELLAGGDVISVRQSNISLSSPHFCIKEAPDKDGVGVYATQDIAAGTRILSEPPLLTLPISATKASFETLIAALPSTKRAALFQLHDCSGGPATAEGIFATNSFGLGTPGTEAGIFLTTCRLNHSCLPNCSHFWHGHLGARTIHASRDVACGEELTLSYISHHITEWGDRQAELEEVYNFTCACEACKLTGPARELSNKRRTTVDSLVDSMNSAFKASQYGEALQLVEARLKLLQEEGLASPSMLYTAEFDAYQACTLARRHAEARVWLESAHMHVVMANGADSERALKMAGMLALPCQ
ncbi:MAG: hypothetical protein WDW36_003454 [Sanguina aurantia]